MNFVGRGLDTEAGGPGKGLDREDHVLSSVPNPAKVRAVLFTSVPGDTEAVVSTDHFKGLSDF